MQPPADMPVVIGGGPAGSAAAIELANADTPVLLLERKRDAHHKVCGEFISWEAAEYLERLGLHLPELGAQAIREVRLYNGHQQIAAPLPHTAWSLSRKRLDAALLAQATAAGATVRQGVSANRLARQASHWQLETTAKDFPTLQANTVFLACGKHDMRQWQRPHQKSVLIGFKMLYQLSKAQRDALHESVEVHLFDRGYAGLEPVEDGKANLCFLISKETYHQCQKQWQAVVCWLGEKAPHLNQRLRHATPCWSRPMAVYGMPYGFLYKPDVTTPGLFRLGDQAVVIPSFAGDGIAMALHSGILAAQHYAMGKSEGDFYRQAQADFYQPLHNACRLEKVMSNRFGRRVGFWLAQHSPALLQHTIAQVRLAK